MYFTDLMHQWVCVQKCLLFLRRKVPTLTNGFQKSESGTQNQIPKAIRHSRHQCESLPLVSSASRVLTSVCETAAIATEWRHLAARSSSCATAARDWGVCVAEPVVAIVVAFAFETVLRSATNTVALAAWRTIRKQAFRGVAVNCTA